MKLRAILFLFAALMMLTLNAVGAAPAGHHSAQAAQRHSHLSPRRIWTRTLQTNADSQPAYLPSVRLRDGKRHALVFVVAGNNTSNCDPGNPVTVATTYAFDAASGTPIWSRSTRGASRCTTAGPVADPSRNCVYAPGLDGKMHRYDAATGKEYTAHGWPQQITLMPDVEKMAATATIANGRLYVTTSGFIGDQGHYEGHLVTIDLTTGSSTVFNSLCSNIHRLLGPSSCTFERSGLFGRGQGVVDPVGHAVYVVSGNGPWDGRTNWGDSVLKLDAAGGRLLDAFTPTNQGSLESADADLGSTGPALLPAIHAGGHTYHLLVQGGKGPACGNCSGVALRLLNRDNLSGRGGPGHLGGDIADSQAPGSCEVLTAPALWTDSSHRTWIFYANDCGVAAYWVTSSSLKTFQIARQWLVPGGGTTPVVAYGAVWVARGSAITAYAPSTGSILWRGTDISGVHWEYPLLAGRRLFMTDESRHLVVYTLG